MAADFVRYEGTAHYTGGLQALTSGVAFCVPMAMSVQRPSGSGLSIGTSSRLILPVGGMWSFTICTRTFGAVGRCIIDLRTMAAGSGAGGTSVRSVVGVTNTTGINTPDFNIGDIHGTFSANDYVELFLTSSVASNSLQAGGVSGETAITARFVAP